MARLPTAVPPKAREHADLLLALAVGIEMQLELFFADGPAGELLGARALVLVLAAGLAVRRSAPLASVALAAVFFVAIETVPVAIQDDELVSPFFVLLFIVYSLGANTDGRRLALGVALILAAGVLAISFSEEPASAGDFLFLAAIIVAGPVLLGRLVRDRSRLGRALRAKADALEEERAARSA